MLNAAGFDDIVLLKRNDADVCIGTSMEEAIDFQILVGPSGEIIREAESLGEEKLPVIREDMKNSMAPHEKEGGVFMPSSTWFIMAVK